jgi:anti-sigma factor RsiW
MCCKGGFDVKDYFWGELPESDRAEAERHVAGCGICSEELAELKTQRGMLMSLPDEEPPQRIGFVSDKVFEPSPFRRWLDSFWTSGARLGFASAAMLSCSILVYSARQPMVVEKRIPAAQVNTTASAPTPVDVQAVVNSAVKAALAEQDKKTALLLAAAEEKHQMEERAMAMRVSDYLTNVEKRMSYNRAVAMDFSSSKGGQ